MSGWPLIRSFVAPRFTRCALLAAAGWLAPAAGPAGSSIAQAAPPAAASATEGAARADSNLGLQAERPASGPCVETPRGFMVPYETTIPGTDVTYRMTPVPGGKFKLGSPAAEAGRSEDEGPQVELEVAPFWIGQFEVTWAEYKVYMRLNDAFKKLAESEPPPTPEQRPFVVTAPSKLYDPGFTFQLGQEPRQPAATMSQFAARQYLKWLGGISGRFYRLPSEVEWEYACRAGTNTAYSFGDDPAQLDDHAWHYGNSKDTTHPVGQKKPNPWGLYDMHGNVAEWTLDEYSADRYAKLTPAPVAADKAIAWPTKLFPRVIRGGSWDDDPERLRSAARRGSHDEDWRAEDPNLPKSPWWFTSQPGLGVGFRIARPLDPPPLADRAKFTEADVESVQEAADRRIDKEGRGGRGVADPTLPERLQRIR